jgi:drug/metabolite transporter (DMT)-like permease
VLGLAIADTVFFAGLRRIDASLAAITDCAYSPAVIALSAVWLGEVLRGGVLVGAPLVVAGIGLVSWRGRGEAAGAAVDQAGVGLAVAGVVMTAIGVVVAKPALERSGLLEATAVRLLAGSVSLFAFQLAAGRARAALALFRPQRAWRAALPATVVGTFLSMLLWLGSMKYGAASRVALLTQTGAIFVLVLSRLFGEAVPARRWLGAAVALSGVAAVLIW